jgi:hypothetical protein
VDGIEELNDDHSRLGLLFVHAFSSPPGRPAKTLAA